MKKLIVLFSLIFGLCVGPAWAMEGDQIDKSGGDEKNHISMVLGQAASRPQSSKCIISLKDLEEKVGINLSVDDLSLFLEVEGVIRGVLGNREQRFENYSVDQLQRVCDIADKLLLKNSLRSKEKRFFSWSRAKLVKKRVDKQIKKIG